MRDYRKLAIPVLALCLMACAKESREAGGLVQHTITAGISAETKAELKADDDTKVLWSAGEVVDVWVGETAYTFTGENASAAASTTFRGTAPADLGTWVLVSPQGAGTGKSGKVISASLPATQTAVADGFDPDAALIAGLGTGATVTCKHLYSGISFTLSGSGVRSVCLRGNAGEKIAGEFSFDISGGTPVISGGTSETIVLNAPGGETFQSGKWYYILCLPVTFSKGITITADDGSEVGYYQTSDPISFSRTRIKRVTEDLSGRMSWEAAKSQVYYGPQNSFIISPGETLVFDVRPRKIVGAWQRSGLQATEASLPSTPVILWGGESISWSSISDGKLTVTASSTPGRSLIAINKGEEILWSYLIWVKGDISETTLPNGKKLLPPLGSDCYFQWGRKDPLLSDASQLGNEYQGLDNSIKHPGEFIKGVASAWDWFCGAAIGDQDATLWGGDSGLKTVWDPCPRGYRVPSEADIADIAEDPVSFFTTENGFPELGILGRREQSTVDYNPGHRSYWTRHIYGAYASGFIITYYYTEPETIEFDGFFRDQALPLRCVRE